MYTFAFIFQNSKYNICLFVSVNPEACNLSDAGGSLNSVFGCPKNRKQKHHKKYISVKEFDVDKLPRDSMDKDFGKFEILGCKEK